MDAMPTKKLRKGMPGYPKQQPAQPFTKQKPKPA
jgi:hypothetical protein